MPSLFSWWDIELGRGRYTVDPGLKVRGPMDRQLIRIICLHLLTPVPRALLGSYLSSGALTMPALLLSSAALLCSIS